MEKFFAQLRSTESKVQFIPSELSKVEIIDQLQEQIEAVSSPCISIKTSKTPPATLESSKFGGLPYFPVGEKYPTDERGKAMRLLAQINFAEVPHLPPFPEEGLLQFYIKDEDDVYGMNFDDVTDTNGFRVLFWKDLSLTSRTDLADLFPKEWEEGPLLVEELSLSFSKSINYPPYPSLEYYAHIHPLFEKIATEDNLDLLEDSFIEANDSASGHRLGGSPFYTQYEVRETKEEYRDFKLLFQMDSDAEKVLWGDVGVCNFFIKKEALEKLDFSEMIYSWDCH